MRHPIIALDADGVLLDYSSAYAKAWERAFSWHPVERDPSAYWPIDRWGVERLTGGRLQQFRACFDAECWSTIPAIDGAVEACHALHDAGFTLVCVSALELRYQAARLNNLRTHGFPIERVIATGSVALTNNPKAAALDALDPLAFVDDYLPYLRRLKTSIHTALVIRQSTGSPNVGAELTAVGSQHVDLLAFSRWWIGSGQTSIATTASPT